MELFLKYPIDVQEELLFKLLHKAKNTEVGKSYNFSKFKTYKDFIKMFRFGNMNPLSH